MKMTEGMRSSEFWVSLATGIFGVLATVGIFTAEDAQYFSDKVGEIAGGIITAVSAAGYAISRGLAKKQ